MWPSTASGIETITVAANGIEFEVAACGHGDRLALCLHGFPEHAYSWRFQMPLLPTSKSIGVMHCDPAA
jgi:epoxide hydrolase 4